jgi:hypothetical protein
MDISKVNPILGYEMYSKADKALINKRTGFYPNPLTEQLQSLKK